MNGLELEKISLNGSELDIISSSGHKLDIISSIEANKNHSNLNFPRCVDYSEMFSQVKEHFKMTSHK